MELSTGSISVVAMLALAVVVIVAVAVAIVGSCRGGGGRGGGWRVGLMVLVVAALTSHGTVATLVSLLADCRRR